MSAFDVRIHAIRRRPDRRRPFEVCWHAGGRARSRSFITRGLADSYRAELIRAARKGRDFSPGTGEPASWDTRAPATISWLEHAAAYAAMKWPLAAAHTRAGIADALATITPALLTPGRGRPPAAVLRTAFYGHAFNPARAGTDPGPAATVALAWASDHCLPLAALADPAVTRRALDALTLRLDGTRAAAATITRKRAVFHGCLGYAAELGLLAANPLDRITWKPPRSSCPAGPRSAATPAEVQAILAEVTRIRPELTAFFGCLYYAALRPAEAVALRANSCALPSRGWGQLTLTASLPRSARAWTGNGTPREPRGLKHRPEGATRTVPIPPQLARLLRRHLHAYRCATDGRLFRGARGGPLSESLYGRIWHQARAAAIRGRARRPAAAPPLRPASCRAVVVAGLRRPARRSRRPRRAQRACPAHHLRPPHTRLRPDRQPAHRASPPPQPLAPGWPTTIRADAGNPVRHASVPQLDPRDAAGPGTSTQIRLDVLDLRKCQLERLAHGSRPRTGRSWAPVLHTPLTCPDLAHHWPTATGSGLPNRSRTRIRPGIREHRHRA